MSEGFPKVIYAMNSICDSFIAYESPDEFAVVGKTVEVGIYTLSGTATIKATVKE